MGKLDLLIDGELRAIERALRVLVDLDNDMNADMDHIITRDVEERDIHFASMLLVHIEAEKVKRFESDLPW